MPSSAHATVGPKRQIDCCRTSKILGGNGTINALVDLGFFTYLAYVEAMCRPSSSWPVGSRKVGILSPSSCNYQILLAVLVVLDSLPGRSISDRLHMQILLL